MALAIIKKTDEQLIKAIADRDENAMAFLYDRYKIILFSIVVRLLNNREEAEDVLQEIFLQIWQKAKNFDETRGRGFTWLVTLTRSRAINRIRSLAIRQRTAVESLSEKSNVVESLEAETIVKQQRKAIANILNKLPKNQRTVLLLAYFEGFSQKEIATKLDAPLGTIKTNMRKATIRLRENFSESLRMLL
jgi:RNA polymerase sigma-70 factor, ECF subfamily